MYVDYIFMYMSDLKKKLNINKKFAKLFSRSMVWGIFNLMIDCRLTSSHLWTYRQWTDTRSWETIPTLSIDSFAHHQAFGKPVR